METKQVRPISVYEILIAPSGVEKSKYINIVSNSCTQIEQYIYEHHYKKRRFFASGDVCETNPQMNEKNNNNNLKNFDCWISQYGSIKQVYTTPSLLHMLSNTSVFFLANEGDAILLESSFYNLCDISADVKQGTLIDAWDGNKLVKSTLSRGSREIKHRSVSICVASTGRRWSDLLRDLSKVQIAGGLHERCTYLCFDVNEKSNTNELTPLSERQFYSSLYDSLLSSNSTNNQLTYSLAQLFFVIKLFDYRIFIWSREAFSFLQPRLQELKTNKSCKLIPETIVFKTKQQLALRRRAAEHTVRYSCLIQMFLNAIHILKSMDNYKIKLSDGALTEEFEIEAKNKIEELFGSALIRSKSFYQNGVPIQPLMISIEAAKSAVKLVFSLLLPQAVLLFNYESDYENSLNEQKVFSDVPKTMTKQEKSFLQIETFIMKLNHKFFHKSCITDRHFRDKRSLVDTVLVDLVNRRLLYQSPNNKPFYSTGRVSSVNTYLKFLPSADDESRFCTALLKYDMKYEEYIKTFDNAPLLPPNCKLTSYGSDYIRQHPYESIINNKGNNSNQPAVDINLAYEQSQLISPVVTNGNNDEEHEQSACGVDNINQGSSIINSARFNYMRTKIESDSVENNDIETNFIDPAKQNVSSATITVTSKGADVDVSNAIISQSDSDDYENEIITDHRPIYVDDDDSLNRLSSVTEGVCTTETIERTNLFSKSSENEKKNQTIADHLIDRQKMLGGEILVLPSLLLTRGFISARIELSSNEMKEALDYLLEKGLLTSGKFLQCAKRKVEAYLKFVPNNIEDRKEKYLLQRRLLDINLSVDRYIESLKKIQFATAFSRPSNLLINTLQEAPFTQLNIDLSIIHKDFYDENKADTDQGSSSHVDLNDGCRRKRIKWSK